MGFRPLTRVTDSAEIDRFQKAPSEFKFKTKGTPVEGGDGFVLVNDMYVNTSQDVDADGAKDAVSCGFFQYNVLDLFAPGFVRVETIPFSCTMISDARVLSTSFEKNPCKVFCLDAHFKEFPTILAPEIKLDDSKKVECVKLADINNDGYLDIVFEADEVVADDKGKNVIKHGVFVFAWDPDLDNSFRHQEAFWFRGRV